MSQPWKNAIVVGASSGMGAEIARQLAASGCRVALVARRQEALAILAANINQAAGETRAFPYAHDVTLYEEVPALFQRICRDLGGLDAVFYTAGIMPIIGAEEFSFEKDCAIVETNLLGAIAWLNEAAHRFAEAHGGTIVGISSVAGDRGRQGNPAYCTSKAALATYLEALRNRLARRGVHVVTIKPGPVDTPMTRGRSDVPMLIPADVAARAIVRAAQKGVVTAYVPWKWRPIMFVIRSIPSFIFRKMKL